MAFDSLKRKRKRLSRPSKFFGKPSQNNGREGEKPKKKRQKRQRRLKFMAVCNTTRARPTTTVVNFEKMNEWGRGQCARRRDCLQKSGGAVPAIWWRKCSPPPRCLPLLASFVCQWHPSPIFWEREGVGMVHHDADTDIHHHLHRQNKQTRKQNKFGGQCRPLRCWWANKCRKGAAGGD